MAHSNKNSFIPIARLVSLIIIIFALSRGQILTHIIICDDILIFYTMLQFTNHEALEINDDYFRFRSIPSPKRHK